MLISFFTSKGEWFKYMSFDKFSSSFSCVTFHSYHKVFDQEGAFSF